MNRALGTLGLWVVIGVFVAGCVPLVPLNQRVLDDGKDTLRLRSMQTRLFDTTDRERVLRDVVATLRDLEYTIAKADPALGVVSGTRQQVRITVTVSPRGSGQLAVRANAQDHMAPVEDPEAYQRFFAALQRAMFLAAHQVD
jgi:hypothetical protein